MNRSSIVCGIVRVSLPLGLLTSGMALGSEPAVPGAAPAPRELVWKFERSLDSLAIPERAQKTREFFASLKDPESRIEAIGMLDSRYVYSIPKGIYPEILGKLLRDPSLKVRTRAAKAVGYNGIAGNLGDVLHELLKSDDVDLKHSVLYALGGSRDLRFVAPIREHLSHPNPSVRIDAAGNLWQLQPDPRELEPLLSDPSERVRSAVVQLIPRSESARRLIADSSPMVRERTARAMGDSGDLSLAPKIARLLNDPEPSVRAQAVYGLGHLRSARHGERIEALLTHDPDVVVRRQAALALAELRSPQHLEGLRAAQKDNDEKVREYAARAIRLIEDPKLDPDSLR